MELNGGKERDCITVLLVDNPHNKFSKNLKKAVTKPVDKLNPLSDGETKTREQWKKYIVEQTEKYEFLDDVSLSTADRVMTKLQEHGYLEENGEKLTASKPVPKYEIDRSQIRKDLMESETYMREYPLWRHLISKAGDF